MRRRCVLAARRRPCVLLLALAGCSRRLQGTGDKGYVDGDGVDHARSPVADRGDPVDARRQDLDGKPLVPGVDCAASRPWSTSGARGAPPAEPRRRRSSRPPSELRRRRRTSSASTAATPAPPQAEAFERALRHHLAVVLLTRRRGAAGLPRHADAQLDPEHRRARRPGPGRRQRSSARCPSTDARRPGPGRRVAGVAPRWLTGSSSRRSSGSLRAGHPGRAGRRPGLVLLARA